MFYGIILSLSGLLMSQMSWSVTIDDINVEIERKGAQWKAGNNRIFNFPLEDQIQMMGAPFPSEDEFSFYSPMKINKELPDVVDWRSKDGMNYMSPVTDQGRCGSCVAFAAVGVMEAAVNIANAWPGLNLNFSEQELFSCGGGRCNRGWYPAMAANELKKTGVTDEACFPYTSGSSEQDVACSLRCQDAESRKIKIKTYRAVSQWTANDSAVMEALQHGPLLSSMRVYEDFMAYTGGIYQHVTGDFLGGHAIVLVGYNRLEEYWIVRNSWGPEWGEQGYFRIKMRDISGISSGAFSFEMEPFGGAAKIEFPSYREIISGVSDVLLASSIAGTAAMKLELSQGQQQYIFDADRAKDLEHFNVGLDTTVLPDGVYQARAIAYSSDEKKETFSTYKHVFILNNPPSIKMSFVDLVHGTVLKDKVDIHMLAKGEPVPVMKLAFVVKDPRGQVRRIKNDQPAELTLMTWNTTRVENGLYEIWIEGTCGQFSVASLPIQVRIAN